MAWTKYRLKDIAVSIQTGPFGSQLHQSDYSEVGTPVVMPKDMIDGTIEESNIARVSEAHVNRLSRHKVMSGDILYSRRGDVGRCAIITEREAGWLCGTGCLKVQLDRSKVVPTFVFYILKRKDSVGWIENHAVGATMPNLNTEILKKLPITLPPLLEQRRIASILSAYDNLIENNTRRIRLLEQMAENIYKEWFVRFRFPGHENAEFENGLPKGWTKVASSTVIDVMSGGTPKTDRDEFYNGQIPFFTPKDANDSIFVYNTLTYITEEGLAHCNSQYYPVDTLMVTARGTVGKLSLLAVPMAMNQSCFALKFKDNQNPYYLYYAMKNEVARLKKMANGGVFDTIIIKTFDHISLVIPTDDMFRAFNRTITPIFGQIQHLERQNHLLARQRDLLLPRLMSGKLEVRG